MIRPQDILVPSASGVCCKLGGFHIDPTRPVERAIITHAHSDHARTGHGAVLATQETLDLMRLRYGANFAGSTQALPYGESINLAGATITLHPAGHVLGSAQVAVEADGLRVVASGLDPTDRVVVAGLANPFVRPGAVVAAREGAVHPSGGQFAADQ